MINEGYYIEHNGECWQSVFPSKDAELSQLHTSIADAIDYMVGECGVDPRGIALVRSIPIPSAPFSCS